jgi:hypothetical protein
MGAVAITEDDREALLTELSDLVNDRDLSFAEMDSRMNYGMIGLVTNKSLKSPLVLTIYRNCFYVMNNEFPLNESTLRMINLIQLLFHDVTRDENNKITPYFINKLV